MKQQTQFSLAAALSYVVIGLIWYLFDDKLKNSKLVVFHVKQALNLFVFSLVFSLITSAFAPLLSILNSIPFMGWVIAGVISLIFGLISIFFLVLWIIGIIRGIEEKNRELPVIGKYAKYYLKF